MLWRTTDLDLVFLSYDEPTADSNFQALLSCAPRAPKRVHGVKGFHAAYSAAAQLSTTDRFITIDADSVVRDELFAVELDDQGMPDLVFAFAARNSVNGLTCGNGSVKCWPKDLLRHSHTHESAIAGPGQMDFHFAYRYWRIPIVGSENCFASTPYHAFRAGYREAVKLSLINGQKLDGWNETKKQMTCQIWSRLLVWLSVGADVPNGLWAILGARIAIADLWIRKTTRPEQIAEYDFLSDLWGKHQSCDLRMTLVQHERILNELSIDAPLLEPAVSRWFKQAYVKFPYQGLFDYTGKIDPKLDEANKHQAINEHQAIKACG
jgi:hypothetical protein